jgi:glycosyltransferase involved in cell wall biosynthesis
MSFYIDLTEFLANPMTTGIQRIAAQICKHLPPNTAIPIRVHEDRYIALSPKLIDLIGEYFTNSTEAQAAEIRQLAAVKSSAAIKPSREDSILVPEVFMESQRHRFFRQMPEADFERCRFIVYDLLPATHPEYFPPEMPLAMSPYYQIVRKADRCGFISAYTRDVYYQRLKRTEARGGVVLPLGSDAHGARTVQPTLNRPLTFSVLGTIEPRKNHELVFNAFEPLLRQIKGLSLWFIGRMGWVTSEFAQRVQSLASDPNSGFRFLSAPGDGTIRSYIEQSRATIYVSAAEGYGLPPVESLSVGTPVIASNMIPSLQSLGSAGIYYVDPLTEANLRRAVLAFVDNEYANRKTAETTNLNLPTWHSFTQEVLRWCQQGKG